MAFDVRCTKCKAKLRLDEAPEPGEKIECPKCGEMFKASSKPEKKAPAPEPKKEETTKPKKFKEPDKKREFMNSFLLLGIVGGCMVALMLVLGTIQYLLNQAGAVVQDAVAYVPADCNIIRGINIKQMKQFPGYDTETDKYYTPEVKDAFETLAKATGQDPGTLLNYLIFARVRKTDGSADPTLYLFALKSNVDRNFAKSIPGAKDVNASGNDVALLPQQQNRLLSNATVYCPNRKLILLSTQAGGGAFLASAIAAHDLPRDDRVTTKIGKIGKLALSSHMWTIIRPVGATKKYILGTTVHLAEGLPALFNAAYDGKASCLAFWSTIGGNGVRVSAGMELNDKKVCSTLVKAMNDGPLGKGDESVPPNDMKQHASITAQNKPFTAFMQYVDFTYAGTAVYFKSRLATTENAKAYLSIWNGDFTQVSGGIDAQTLSGIKGGAAQKYGQE